MASFFLILISSISSACFALLRVSSSVLNCALF